jgi:hypothetical protein
MVHLQALQVVILIVAVTLISIGGYEGYQKVARKIAIGLFFIACLTTIVGLILPPSVFVLAKVKNDVASGNDIGVYEKDNLGNNSQVAAGGSTNMTASNMTSSTSTSPNTNANNTANTSTNATNRSSTLSIKSLIEDMVENSTTTKFVQYENSSYGIKMQYPSHWRVEGTSNSSIVASFYPQTNNAGYVTVQIKNLTTNYTPDQYLNSLMLGDKADYKDFPDIRFNQNTTNNIILASHPGYLLNGTFRDPTSDALQRFTNIGTIIGGKEYSVIYYSPPETYPAYNTIYDKMIKSFEVILQKSIAVNSNPTSNTTNLVSDVRVVSQQSQRTAGFIFLIHYIVYGNVANFGNGTSGPITVHLQITSRQGAVLYSTDGSTIPDTLAPKQEGKFTFEFTSDDLGGYKSFDWTYGVSVVKQ